MNFGSRLSFFALCLAVLSPEFGLSADVKTSTVDFQRDIQPLFRRHCYRCHGQTKSEGGFRLTSRKSALGEGDSGESVISPKKPGESLLLTRIRDESYGDVMPLDAEPLAAKEIRLIEQWIKEGAPWPDDLAEEIHWAYQTSKRPALPKTGSLDWGQNAIDNFVLARLQFENLSPSPPASRARLLRRVSLALTGLPPSPEEVAAFEQDSSPDAYEKAVDQLLASKRFGERWAQHWLDLARYADSNGFQADQLRDSWAYRDWVIDAFNRDQSFDQFVIEQLAGDLLPNATTAQKIATGFHRTPTCNVEAGVHPEANRVNQVFDRVNTTGTVFLGTTMECCQCHDHKYDPFTQKDYYQLFAYFNNTPLEVELNSGVQYNFYGPTMPLPLSSEQQDRRELLETQLKSVEAELAKIQNAGEKEFARWKTESAKAIAENPAVWTVAKIEEFQSSGGEDFESLPDHSILLSGSLPGTTEYKLQIAGPISDIIGIKVEALTHESLPGKGPGRGDAERTNFILSEITAARTTSDGKADQLPLTGAQADFSQQKWSVANAIDGNRKTGWAISPEFHKPHWATFRFVKPVTLADGEKLTISLDQNYGRGRVMGRVRLSLLTGSELAADISADIANLLEKTKPNKKERARLVEYFEKQNPEVARLKQQIASLNQGLSKVQPDETLVMVELEKSRDTFVMNRGNYLDPGQKVKAGTPEVLHPLAKSLPPNRLGLAQWLTDPANPLLSRVTVNRWWAEIFGQGLVSTEEDFGTQAEPPTHPQLLDWLAVEFVESGWSMQHILKLMVMSETFQQSAVASPSLLAVDPQNRWLARGPRFRLSAETIRDNALAVSGLLSTKMHGPPIMPYQPGGIWRAVGRNQPKWVTATNEDRFRRGVYIVWKRGAPYPSFVNFDAPDRAACTVQRPRTNTPLQALTLMNDPAYAEMSCALAQRMLVESPEDTVESRIRYGFRLCVAREPKAVEIKILTRLYHTELQKVKSDPQLAKARTSNLLPKVRNANVTDQDLAVLFAVANVLLNLDETMSL